MKPKQPFIHVEDLKIKLRNETDTAAIVYSIDVYGFTSKFYLYTTMTIIYLAGVITGALAFKC